MPPQFQFTVAPADVDAFQRDGAACLRQVYDRRWLEAVAAGIARNLAAPGPASEFLGGGAAGGRFFDDYCHWREIPEFRDYVYESPSAQIAAQLMRSQKAIFYHEHVLVKEPGADKRTPWHQDQPYYPVDGRQVCSIWMPVDAVPLESTLLFVKGSHAWGRWFVPRKFASASNYQINSEASGVERYETVPDIDGELSRYELLAWALEPGDCVVFHGATLHGAAGNVSLSRSRRALSTRWLGDDARFAERPWEISPPITGGLSPGAPMACAEFPVIWPRS